MNLTGTRDQGQTDFVHAGGIVKYDQVLCDYLYQVKGDYRYLGGANCPTCGKRNEVVMPATAKKAFGVLHPIERCEHADMAVNAGGFDIAVQFRIGAVK